jgi:uncharacterized protein YcnI
VKTSRSFVRRGLLATVLGVGLVGVFASAASAHVTISPGEAPADGYVVLTVAFGHGCEDSPTTQLRIQMPEDIPEVAPSLEPDWTVEKVTETLDEPIDMGEGETLTERVSEVVYTANTPVPNGYYASMDMSVKLPNTPDETIYFPVIQTCESGETAWIEIPVEGEEEPEHPAPGIALTEATGGHGGGGGDEADAEAEEAVAEADAAAGDAVADEAAADSDSDDSSSNTLAIVALVVGALGVILGGVAFASSRKA